MPETDLPQGLDGFEALLHAKANELVSVLAVGDVNSALDIVNDLQNVKHLAFYNEVGYLTRGLHEAIKSFSGDVPSDAREDSIQGMTDASDRLAYVMELTEKTSHETMDRVDKSLALVDKMDVQSGRFADLLSLVGQLESEFEGLRGVYDRTCQLKQESESTVAKLREELTGILVAQSYQDITGQLIRRVITLVTQVEGSLVQLMNMAAKVESISGLHVEGPTENKKQNAKKDPIEAEGPQLAGENNPEVVGNQDDVDDLLSSLGF
ncbi:protein phosphatase CheZ [Neptunomonas antarctica]|uniref:Protein phosphatase CheZ n=1 Tax=Neptunomonas antarctica TaxID=619304 RepID=A0A1N7JCM3_9GAMM|nr:protein phosphatase CheZ [Neptunomonas antarctica]SIS47059.1 chemotaxis protein CheZ [Neptunomonas antarctica]